MKPGFLFMAVREGFEPSVRCRTHTFQACSFDHSDTSPKKVSGAELARGCVQTQWALIQRAATLTKFFHNGNCKFWRRPGLSIRVLLIFGAHKICMLVCSASTTVLRGARTANAGLLHPDRWNNFCCKRDYIAHVRFYSPELIHRT